MYFSSKRQQFLVDQGYEFKVISEIEGMDDGNKVHATLFNQLELLNTCLLASMNDLGLDEIDDELEAPKSPDVIRSTSSNLVSLSGGDSMAFLEYSRGTTSNLAKKPRKV